MELREVNFNTTASRGKSGPPMATYISPPRPNKQKHVATSQLQQVTVAPTVTDTSLSSSSFPYATPMASMRMAEMSDTNYAECPCATCAQYRAYYAIKMSGNTEPRPENSYAASASYVRSDYCLLTSAPQPQFFQRPSQQQQQQQELQYSRPPVMTSTPHHNNMTHAVTVGMQQAKIAAVPQADVFHAPQQPSLGQYPEATVSLPPGQGAAMMPFDAADEFGRKCMGRVVELSCTAEGRSMLLTAMRSQDAMVINTMVKEIVADVETVALDSHGCHVLRVLIDYMNGEQVALLVSSFNETLVLNLCTVSQYTRRILQSLFERPLIDLQPIVNVLTKNAQYLAATQQGCISLMRIFELCTAEQKVQMMTPLVPLFKHIALDPFGNYVVQCAIEHSGRMMAAQYTVSCFAGELLNMSCNKYASNAVEKIIKTCGDVPAVRRLLLDELIFNPAALLQMVQDNFGNFVVQSIIEHTENPSELKRICDRLRPALPSSPYAARIEAKIRAKYPPAQQQQSNNHQHQYRKQAPRQTQTRRPQQRQ